MYEYDFSAVYDKLQDADYKSIAEYYKEAFRRFGKETELVLDLGCGTGSITLELADAGYDMIGVDLSWEMLDIARSKAEEKGKDILFLNQDMTDFELYGTVDAIVSTLDSVNYITEEGGVLQMMKLCKNYLNPGGIFIFDINSEYKLKEVLGCNTFVYDEEDVFYVWQNYYDEESEICDFELNFFVKDGENYKRFDEYQSEKVYKEKELREYAKSAGLEVLGVFDGYSFNEADENTERLVFVLKKHS